MADRKRLEETVLAKAIWETFLSHVFQDRRRFRNFEGRNRESLEGMTREIFLD